MGTVPKSVASVPTPANRANAAIRRALALRAVSVTVTESRGWVIGVVLRSQRAYPH